MKKQVLLLSLLMILLPAFSLSAQNGTSYRRMMAEISNRYDKSFVYESGLPLDQPYHGPALSGANLQRDLRLLFRGSLYRFSPELYNYLAAQYNNGHSNSTPYGLSPVNSTYSNVSGGYGIFGALSTPAETPWLNNPDMPLP
ncbi:MAG: DUF4249 family protein [Bacteroidales bacterium]|nr:DUF4249 family protein [Bacteroidales bacterium]